MEPVELRVQRTKLRLIKCSLISLKKTKKNKKKILEKRKEYNIIKLYIKNFKKEYPELCI